MVRSRAVNKISVSCLVFIGLAAVLATPSAATVIRDVSGSDNTSPPPPGDNPGWANVGRRGGLGGAVYLGDRWVLTVAHVGGGTVTFGGKNFSMEGSWHQLHDPDNPSTEADLGLFRLRPDSTLAGLTNLAISQSTPTNNSEVVGIGFGLDYDKTETWWNSDWEKETGEEKYHGFELGDTLIKRWGKNHIDGRAEVNTSDLSGNEYTTQTLAMDFDQSGGAGADEMQAVSGDSGGGLFYWNGSGWELAGVFVAAWNPEPGQPKKTAVYGNLSYAADLSQYRDEIMEIIPEPSALAMLLGLGVGCLVWAVWRRASRPARR